MKCFGNFFESTYSALYQSAVDAFPHTTKRQHVKDSVKIEGIKATPFLGMKTLLLRCQADNTEGNGGIHNSIILFRNVEFHDDPGPNIVEITASDNKQTYYLSPVLESQNDVLCRCQCQDFFFRFNYYNSLDRSLYGRVRSPYIRKTDWAPPANPLELEGVCKHLMKFFDELKEIGLLND